MAPMIIYPYRLPRDITESVPENFYMATSESGWMKSETFFEYLANAFNPWLEEQNISKPVILFVDGHKTHLTMQASKFCEDHQIVLYLLPPNTTHILQPADVGAFKPMKDYLRQEVLDFQKKNPNSVIKRRDVAPLLSKALNKIPVSAITNGFKATGLYPLEPNRVDYTKCLEIGIEEEDGTITNIVSPDDFDFKGALRVVDMLLGEENLEKCKCKEGTLNMFENMYQTLMAKASQKRTIVLNDNCEVVKCSADEVPQYSGGASEPPVENSEESGPTLD